MSSNSPGAFVHIYLFNFYQYCLSKFALLFADLTCILLIHHTIYHNQVISADLGETLSSCSEQL